MTRLIVPALPPAPGFRDCEWVCPAQPALQSDDKLVAAVNGPSGGLCLFWTTSLTAPKATPFSAPGIRSRKAFDGMAPCGVTNRIEGVSLTEQWHTVRSDTLQSFSFISLAADIIDHTGECS